MDFKKNERGKRKSELTPDCMLKEQCHKDFAVLGKYCAKIITLSL